MKTDPYDSAQQLRQFLEIEKAFGILELPITTKSAGSKKTLLDDLKKEYQDCAMCALSQTRTKLVFGSGSPDAKLIFIGEAPGCDEDRQGRSWERRVSF